MVGTRIEDPVTGQVFVDTPGKRADRTAHLGPSATVLWSALRDELAAAAVEAGAEIRLGDRLQAATVGDDGRVALTFGRDGGDTHSVTPALAVGADGASSALRAALLPDDPPPCFSGTAVWRGATPTPPSFDPDVAGWRLYRGSPASMIVYSRARPGHAVWQLFAGGWPAGRLGELASVAHISGDRDAAASPADCLARAVSTVPDWPHDLRALIEGADAATVAEHPLLFRRPDACRTWAVGAAALLGDAAHLATPLLGQGTSAAFEDALALGRAVREAGAGAAAAAAYAAARRERAAAVQGLSVALFERQAAGESVDEIGEHLGAGFMEATFEALV